MFEPHKVAYRHPRYKTAYRVKKIIGWIAALPKSDEFSFTKVQDVVTNCRDTNRHRNKLVLSFFGRSR